MPPKGGGEVIFISPIKKALNPIQFIDPGKIKRIRGMAYPSLQAGFFLAIVFGYLQSDICAVLIMYFRAILKGVLFKWYDLCVVQECGS